MKYRDGNFIQINRDLFKYSISPGAKWLYVVLCELEHKFTDGWGHKDYFYRITEDLEKDSGLTAKTIRKYREELEKVRKFLDDMVFR
uniref:Uncharacterized protein n=1 Tax=candidate division WOR-3 bacterium TaxID=2052148 RepID=A0A7V3KPD3_UNCW3